MLESAGPDAAADPDAELTLMERLISRVSLFTHPECRRSLNRCLRHHDARIQQRAAASLSSARRRSPAEVLLVEVMQLKSEMKFEEALKKANDCVEADGMLSDVYLYRASLYLREDRFAEAMTDLQTADRLCPEEPSTLSTMALVQVRTHQLQEGLRLADESLSLMPKDNSMLYNTACVYARAAEVTQGDDQQRHQTRAVQLLKESVEAGFYDVRHMQHDPDLVTLHQRAEWPGIVDRAAENEKTAANAGAE
jgi:tetratricopeptide (TPR) repeat protein